MTARRHPRARPGTLPEWEEERWRNANSRRIELARRACRFHAGLWILWWVLLAVMGYDLTRSLSRRLLITLELTAGLPWLVLTLLLILLAGWFGVRFRYLAWCSARACGAVVRLVRERWHGFLMLLASLFLAWTGYRTAFFSGLWGGQRGEDPLELWQVGAGLLALAVLTLAAVLWSSYRVRRRIVVQPLKDLTGLPDLPKGLSERLCGELATIANLYRTINELPGERTGQVYGPAVDVRDVGDLLEGAVGTEVSIDLKFLKLPLELLLALGRRLLYEGRLSGSLHRQDGRLVLLASMTGNGPARNWKVEPEDLDAEDRDQPLPVLLDKMIQQLAFRIATDLVATGSPKWRAVRFFTEGLRAYREAQRTDIQKYPRLRRAERSLIKALGEDQQFALCHYNLGVVYRQMGEGLAAEAAFRRALQNNSEPSAACYALAEGHYQDGRYLDALWFTKNGIRRRPADPRAWHLRAVSLYHQHHQTRESDGQAGEPGAWQEILETEKIGVALAWWDLCAWLAKGPAQISELTASQLDRSEETANNTLGLATATVLWSSKAPGSRWKWLAKLLRRRRMARAQRTFEQAARLSPADATLYSRWVWVLFQQEDPDLLTAARVLDHVFAGGLNSPADRMDFWSRWLAVHAGLADSHPHDDHQHIAEEAYAYLLDFAGLPAWETCADLATPLKGALSEINKVVQPKKEKTTLSSLEAAAKEMARSLGENPEAYAARLKRLAHQLESKYLPAFYTWRLTGVIDDLTRLAGCEDPEQLSRLGAETEAYFMERMESLEDLQARLTGEKKPEPPPPFLLSLYDLLRVRREDWSWAYAQALASLARRQLDSGDQRHERARWLLSEAISRLEAGRGGHRQQIVEQLLYSRLAYAYLLDADLAGRKGDAGRRSDLLKKGLEHAEISVALRPEGKIEHFVLGQILQELGDYERAKREWDLTSFLDPAPEVLSMIGESFWRRAMEMNSRDFRCEALKQAIQFFKTAQELYESGLPGKHENLGEVHYWLGSFYREMLQYDKAIFHHKVAGSMGFRPLEARTSLAWTYLEAGLCAEAESLFEEVYKAARHELSALKDPREGRSAGPGEAMPIHEVLTRIHLGRALLYADQGTRLQRAEELVHSAFRCTRFVRSYKCKELRARCFECLAWIYLQRQQLEEGTEAELKRAFRFLGGALHFFARAEAHWLLAQVHWSRSALPSCQQAQELARARDACERSRASDLRGRRLHDIEALLARIAEAELPKASGSPAAARRS